MQKYTYRCLCITKPSVKERSILTYDVQVLIGPTQSIRLGGLMKRESSHPTRRYVRIIRDHIQWVLAGVAKGKKMAGVRHVHLTLSRQDAVSRWCNNSKLPPSNRKTANANWPRMRMRTHKRSQSLLLFTQLSFLTQTQKVI